MTFDERHWSDPPALCAGLDAAESDAASTLRALFQELGSARVARGGFATALGELGATADEAEQADWDGYGGLPVSARAYWRARALLFALPQSFPEPEIGADPRGGFLFTWRAGPGRAFSIAVNESDDLNWAGISGPAGFRGHDRFVSSVPAAVVQGLQRIFPAMVLLR